MALALQMITFPGKLLKGKSFGNGFDSILLKRK